MSFYSIIEDYFEKPPKYPIVVLTFKNWVSFIAIIYVFLVFIIGVIFSYNKDN
jgi:amino acid permease